MKSILLWLFLLFSSNLWAQPPGLEQCLEAASKHQPAAQQLPLIQSVQSLANAQLSRNYWPQLQVNAQATWQSEVTALPLQLPGIQVEGLSKDQYKVQAELSQTIWDGGLTSKLKSLQNSQSQSDQSKLIADLYPVKQQVLQAYMAVLLAQQQSQVLDNNLIDIERQLLKLEEWRKAGTAIPAQLAQLQVRKLEVQQLVDELTIRKSTAIQVLQLLTGLDINTGGSFPIPAKVLLNDSKVMRPELAAISAQQQVFLNQEHLSEVKAMPKIIAFANVGYGRPGLNFLDNNFRPYTIAGIQLKWNPGSWWQGTQKLEQQQWKVQSQKLQEQKSQFEWSTRIQLENQMAEIKRLEALLAKDQQIIEQRQHIARTAEEQWKQGIISTSDLLSETIAATNARLNFELHQIQQLQAEHQYLFIQGKL